jgi:hypothetical protein
MRQEGFYWVKPKPNSEWQVGLYTVHGIWCLQHGESAFKDSELFMIHENRIPEPEAGKNETT